MSFITSATGGIRTNEPVVVDTSIVRWDGTSGKLVEDSLALLDDNGYLNTTGFLMQDNIALGVTLTIGATQQMLAINYYILNGTLVVGGTFMVL